MLKLGIETRPTDAKTLSNDSSSAWDWGLCFRQLCLRRWSSCKASQMTLGTQSWKQYYLRRSELEFRMASGRPEDFTCRALAGHKGMGWQSGNSVHSHGFPVMSPGIWSFSQLVGKYRLMRIWTCWFVCLFYIIWSSQRSLYLFQSRKKLT